MTFAVVDEPLSAGILARRLGVATTTLRTWHQRYGLGPSEHQSGRHRRYTSRDIARLTVMAQLTTRGVPAAEAARRARRESTPWTAERPCGGPGTDAEARGIARAARRMDVLVLRETLAAAVAGHGVVHTWHTLVGPAFAHLDHARCPEVHRTIARRLLGRTADEVFGSVARPPAGTPVSVLLVGDVVALAAALAERGIASVHLGAGLDQAVIDAAVARIGPAVVVFWGGTYEPAAESGWRPAVVEAGPGRQCPDLADTVEAVATLVTG